MEDAVVFGGMGARVRLDGEVLDLVEVVRLVVLVLLVRVHHRGGRRVRGDGVVVRGARQGEHAALVGRLHGDDEVGAVGHHHVGDLVERLARHFDAVHFEHLIVHCEEAGRLGEPAGHQSE